MIVRWLCALLLPFILTAQEPISYSPEELSTASLTALVEKDPKDPFLEEGPSFTYLFFLLLVFLFLVGLIIWAFKKIQKASESHTQNERIKILEQKHLSPKTLLYLLKVDGKKVLISESQIHVQSLFEGDIQPFKMPEKKDISPKMIEDALK